VPSPLLAAPPQVQNETQSAKTPEQEIDELMESMKDNPPPSSPNNTNKRGFEGSNM
jgi:hypothetical protein